MLKTKEFKGTINVPSIDNEINNFLKEMSSEQVIDLKYNSNVVNYKKSDGSTDVIVITSALLLYEE